MKLLVTGCGFIGSHLIRALIQSGHDVRVLDSADPTKALQNLAHSPSLKIFHGDIMDFESCLKVTEGAEAVFHTAGVALVPECRLNPERTIETNVKGTENLLKASIRNNVPKFIYSSTGKLYGAHTELPSKETDSLDPGTVYARTKLQAEEIVKSYAGINNLSAISLRYFSVYGPGMKLYGGMIGDVLKAVFNGGFVKLDAVPSLARDYTYIDDVVQANLLALENTFSGYKVFNVGSGASWTIDELIVLIRKHCRREFSVSFNGPLEGTALRTQADIAKVAAMMGYEPKIQFEEGLRKTVAWINGEYFQEGKSQIEN